MTHEKSVAAQARQILQSKGQASVAEIAEEIGVEDSRPIGQALGAAVKQGAGVERITRGVYRWTGTQPTADGGDTPEDLLPLVDWLDDTAAFEACGLTLVARGKDGSFIATDDNMRAWRVEVKASARML